MSKLFGAKDGGACLRIMLPAPAAPAPSAREFGTVPHQPSLPLTRIDADTEVHMGTISPTPSRRALLGAFAATSTTLVAAPATAETLRREFEAWDDTPIVLRRSQQGRSDSRYRYHNAEHFFIGIEQGAEWFVGDRFDLLYRTGIVIQLGLSSHLFDVGFTDDWCRRHIGLRIAKSLGYANATGFAYHDLDTELLAAILTPYGKWRNAMPSDGYDEGPFTTEELRTLTRALLDHVRHVTGHPRPDWWERRHV
jgi:hypothetical protein